MESNSAHATRLFRIAAIYGVVVLLPMYALEPMLAWRGSPPLARPEFLYGFVGASLAFQAVLWMIAGDPTRFRGLMPVAVVYKWSFGLPAVALYLAGRIDAATLAFGCIDLVWGLLFLNCWRRVAA